jgi:uridine monophosphate synthetase
MTCDKNWALCRGGYIDPPAAGHAEYREASINNFQYEGLIMQISPQHEALAIALHRIGALKFGEFKLKSGLISPFYVDLRLLASHPDVLELAGAALAGLVAPLNYDRLAAIPYAALPIGVALSLNNKRPLIYPRKEKKEYGTGNLIEGEFKAGETALVIDDLITKGDSKIEAIKPLKEAGLIVNDIAVILDRESGGTAAMAAVGIKVHALLNLTEMLDILQKAGKLDDTSRQKINDWLKENS